MIDYVAMYAALVKNGKITLYQVPAKYQEKVRIVLIESGSY